MSLSSGHITIIIQDISNGFQIFIHCSFRFNKRKGFYCQVTSHGGTNCLGKGKGRHYGPMDAKSQRFLESYYKQPNKNLVDLLQLLKKPLPEWLKPKR